MIRYRNRTAHLAIAFAAIGVLGLLVRYGPKDRFIAFAPIYYALPLIAIAACFVVSAILLLNKHKFVFAVVASVIASTCALLWINDTRCSNRDGHSDPNSISVLTWNAGRTRNLPAVIQSALDRQVDIIALVESGDLADTLGDMLSNSETDYRVADLGGGLTVLAKGEIADRTLSTFGYRNRIGECAVHLGSEVIPLMIVDIDSNPFVSRRLAVGKMLEPIRGVPAALILGDFNTPPDSVWFDDIRENYVHAFEEAGNGMHVTWPSYLPFLAIDHIWVGRSFTVLSADILDGRPSDHRPVMTEISHAGVDPP